MAIMGPIVDGVKVWQVIIAGTATCSYHWTFAAPYMYCNKRQSIYRGSSITQLPHLSTLMVALLRCGAYIVTSIFAGM